MSIIEIVLGIICVTRITEILVYEKIMIRVREFFGLMHSVNGSMFMGTENKLKDFIGNILSCFSCTTVWVSGFVLGLYYLSNEIFIIFALWMVFSFFAKKLDLLDTLIQTRIEVMGRH